MALRDRLTGLVVRPHLPRRTLRLRLTALYGALFLASGIGLLAVTYVLVSHATGGCYTTRAPDGGVFSVCGSRVESTDRPPSEGPTTQGAVGPPGVTPPSPAQVRLLEAQARAQHDAQLHQLLVDSGIALGVMAITSIALGWIVAGRVLRPLRTITTAARRISETSLHERLALAGPNDELKELGDTFDDLLARLERSFDAQRRFVANASHELRTPLARQRTVAQVALGDPDATVDSLREAHERVLASGEQQERLIEALLLLARGQGGLGKRDPFDLASLTGEVLLTRRAEAERRGLDLHEALSPASAAGDPRLVERLIANLIDNAISYNVSGGRIDVWTGMKDGLAVLSVANSGPVVPATDVDRLLQPFQRLGADRTGHGKGVGLGLSIVQAIADAHGAVLDVRPHPGGGLDVEVSFAALAAPDADDPASMPNSPNLGAGQGSDDTQADGAEAPRRHQQGAGTDDNSVRLREIRGLPGSSRNG